MRPVNLCPSLDLPPSLPVKSPRPSTQLPGLRLSISELLRHRAPQRGLPDLSPGRGWGGSLPQGLPLPQSLPAASPLSSSAWAAAPWVPRGQGPWAPPLPPARSRGLAFPGTPRAGAAPGRDCQDIAADQPRHRRSPARSAAHSLGGGLLPRPAGEEPLADPPEAPGTDSSRGDLRATPPDEPQTWLPHDEP